mgnify:CR=1 FL=1
MAHGIRHVTQSIISGSAEVECYRLLVVVGWSCDYFGGGLSEVSWRIYV